jgi:hypothetical protein
MHANIKPIPGEGQGSPSTETVKRPEEPSRVNPGDPGPALPEQREPVDPTDDPAIPEHDFPRGV